MKVTRKRRREAVCRLHDASSSLPPGAWEFGDRRHASSSPSRRRQSSNSGSEKASREGISHLCPCVSLFSYSSPPAHLLRLSVSPLHLIHQLPCASHARHRFLAKACPPICHLHAPIAACSCALSSYLCSSCLSCRICEARFRRSLLLYSHAVKLS